MASNNSGKIAEFRALLAGIPLTAPLESGIDHQVAETGISFLQNAFLKARACSRASGQIAIADDSGLEIDALDGRPGIHSARYGGPELDDAGRVQLILKELSDVPPARRQARFRCCIAAVSPDGRCCTADGVCRGRLTTQPNGVGGFGYDPIFYLATQQKSMAQLTPAEKNLISHRGHAMRTLRPQLLTTFPELRS